MTFPFHAKRVLDDLGRTLIAPLLPLEHAPSPAGWKLLGWDVEQGFVLTLAKDDSVLLFELEPLDEAKPCYGRTARFNVQVRHSLHQERPLNAQERRVVDQVVRVVREREGLLPVVERQPAGHRASVREIEVERVLVQEAPGQYYINPYVGCMMGCDFCYVADRADLSRSYEGLPALPWGRYVDVKVNAAEVLREEIRRAAPGVVRMSPILTDPYQPIEHRYRITRQCLEVLLEGRFIPVLLTRAARVQDDLDVLTRFPKAAVGLSIATDDERVRQRFEAGCDPIDERLEALERCHAAGLVTFGCVQPMLPMNPARLVERMAPFVRTVRIDRMYEMHRTRRLYEEAGCPEAAEDAWFERTGQALREGFTARGVRLHDLDDLAEALDLRS